MNVYLAQAFKAIMVIISKLRSSGPDLQSSGNNELKMPCRELRTTSFGGSSKGKGKVPVHRGHVLVKRCGARFIKF